MRKRNREADADEAEIDLTPMLDVVFIMLIFFIVVASFLKEAGIEIPSWPVIMFSSTTTVWSHSNSMPGTFSRKPVSK